jgi:hypothetical protein
MSAGKRFLQKCLDTTVELDPWPHQILDDTFEDSVFEKLRTVSTDKLANIKTADLIHIHPAQYKDYGIDFYDETLDICDTLYKNIKEITDKFPESRYFENLGVNAHVSITPPLPYKFYIHQEGLEKIWSSVTYISPKDNVGTKMYTAQHEDAFVKEAKWRPNTTFIFCGKQRKTWHSYESNQDTNRITFNLFIMKYRSKKCFFPL